MFRYDSVLHFLDVSVILPVFNLRSFNDTISQNISFFQQNGIEIVVVFQCDDVNKIEVKKIIKLYSRLNWIILFPHHKLPKTCRLSVMINEAIRRACMSYILVIPQGYYIQTKKIQDIRETLTYYTNHFAVWSTNITRFSECFLITRRILNEIGGYRELLGWNEIHNDLRQRLEANGIRKLYFGENQLNISLLTLRNISKSKIDTFKVFYDWHTDRFDVSSCDLYLKQFIKHTDISEDLLMTSRKLLLLVPVRNESRLIAEFIDHMLKFCDGMIFLDDDSTDNTYEIIEGEKVLLKVQKEHVFFNDLENRNILLDLASFFNAEWVLFMDVDERFDPRYCNLINLMNQNDNDTYAFNFIHLWNNLKTYNCGFPGSRMGVVETCRMFRYKGYMQIKSQKKLHFATIPYFTRLKYAKILVLHLGYLDPNLRYQKYHFYQKEDNYRYQKSYDHLIDNTAVLKEVKKLQI